MYCKLCGTIFVATEEEDKRRRETVAGSGTFHAVGYSYADEYGEEDADDGTTQPACQHSTTSRVDTEEEMFILPPDLVVPNCLVLVCSDVKLCWESVCWRGCVSGEGVTVYRGGCVLERVCAGEGVYRASRVKGGLL